jgi:hypothetical protein
MEPRHRAATENLRKAIASRGIQSSRCLRSREMTDVFGAALSGIGFVVLPCLLGDAEPALTRLTPQVIATQNLAGLSARIQKF